MDLVKKVDDFIQGPTFFKPDHPVFKVKWYEDVFMVRNIVGLLLLNTHMSDLHRPSPYKLGVHD
jgi:hypothetical protein